MSDKALITDLGMVIVSFTETMASIFGRYLPKENLPKDLRQQIRIEDFGRGTVTADEFCRLCNEVLAKYGGQKLSADEIRTACTDFGFTLVEEMADLVRKLRLQGKRVYLLTNTNVFHWEYQEDKFKLYDLFGGEENVIASHEVGYRKPDSAIYRLAEQKFGLKPEDIIFIDDLLENVEGARGCGWNAILHQNPTETIERVEKFIYE